MNLDHQLMANSAISRINLELASNLLKVSKTRRNSSLTCIRSLCLQSFRLWLSSSSFSSFFSSALLRLIQVGFTVLDHFISYLCRPPAVVCLADISCPANAFSPLFLFICSDVDWTGFPPDLSKSRSKHFICVFASHTFYFKTLTVEFSSIQSSFCMSSVCVCVC